MYLSKSFSKICKLCVLVPTKFIDMEAFWCLITKLRFLCVSSVNQAKRKLKDDFSQMHQSSNIFHSVWKMYFSDWSLSLKLKAAYLNTIVVQTMRWNPHLIERFKYVEMCLKISNWEKTTKNWLQMQIKWDIGGIEHKENWSWLCPNDLSGILAAVALPTIR